MFKKLVPVIFVSVFAPILTLAPFSTQPSQAGSSQFVCQNVNGVPTTVFKTPGNSAPVVVWKTKEFDRSPKQRCIEVTANFNRAVTKYGLTFLTTDKRKNLENVCASNEIGGSCKQHLFSLPKQMNTSAAIDKLGSNLRGLSATALMNGRPSVYLIYKSKTDGFNGDRPYIDLNAAEWILNNTK